MIIFSRAYELKLCTVVCMIRMLRLFYRYEGTGRSLSLKLVQQLRQQSATFGASSEVKKTVDMTTKTDNITSSTATGENYYLLLVGIQESQRIYFIGTSSWYSILF